MKPQEALLVGLIGVLVGAILAYLSTKLLDRARRKNDARDVSESLYNEIADRAARCLNDHLVPWCQFETSGRMTSARVARFRPIEPVVYRAVAGKLGLIPPVALFSVLQFYYQLDTIDREIEDIKRDYKYKAEVDLDRAHLVAQRFRQSLAPALEALEKLGAVRNFSEIDQQAALTYPHVAKLGKPLREALRTALSRKQ
jgi:hypothetical protein